MCAHDVNKLTLISYFTGDLGREKKAVVEKHLSSCEPCRDYLKELKEEQSSFLATAPFESLPEKSKKKNSTFFRTYYAIAATLVLVIAGGLFYRTYEAQDAVRIKGETGIKLFSLDTSGTIVSRENNIYYPGDRIQITYSCTDRQYLILFSIDEKGVVSKYYPSDTDSSIILEKGADVPLPNSIALDTYIGRELYIALFSGHRVYLPDILNQVEDAFAIQGLSKEIAPEGNKDFNVHTLIITKVERAQ